MNSLILPPDLVACVEQTIDAGTGSSATIVDSRAVSGGCINSTAIITLEDRRRFFIKYNSQHPELFAAESLGLAAIQSTQAIRAPNVIGHGQTTSLTGFLVLEAIETGARASGFSETFGQSLATMHKQGSNAQFGFIADNHIGSTVQKNTWTESWIVFWAEQRLEFQLKLAVKNGIATQELIRDCTRLISRLDQLIGIDEDPPSLLHGDLWSGNFMVSSSGVPVLIDPAAYFGSREAEFGMTTLFGGFDSQFYQAYNEVWPLVDGWEERVEIYRLYHLLNHLNLFGQSYLDGCLEILRKFN